MSQQNVLVVEDENLVALDIARSLERHGYGVLGPVASGEAAIALSHEHRPDCVLMDIVLKGSMDGITAAAHISDTTGAPVIFLTAHADHLTLDRAKLTEPSAYLLKPFDDTQLRAALEMIFYKSQQTNGKTASSAAARARTNGNDGASQTSKVDFLRAHPFFSQLSDYELSFLAEASTSQVFRAGSLLSEAGDKAQPFIAQSGRVAMIESSAGGKELIVELLPPGDLLGLLPALDNSTARFICRANRESRILFIPKKSLLLLLESRPALSLRFAEYVSQRLRASQTLARAIAYDDVATRIASVLMALAPRFGQTNGDAHGVCLDLSRQELASLTGATAETVVRVLKAMESEGLIRSGRRKRIEISDIRELGRRVGDPAEQ